MAPLFGANGGQSLLSAFKWSGWRNDGSRCTDRHSGINRCTFGRGGGRSILNSWSHSTPSSRRCSVHAVAIRLASLSLLAVNVGG